MAYSCLDNKINISSHLLRLWLIIKILKDKRISYDFEKSTEIQYVTFIVCGMYCKYKSLLHLMRGGEMV